MVDVRMHPDDVEAFCAGRLDEAGEAALALHVAQTVPYESHIPNQASMYLRQIATHLGGDQQLIEWLARFPGEPSLVAATVRLSDLLNSLSGDDVVVTAVREMRDRQRDPEDLQRYLTPDTTHATLSTLAEVLMRRLRGGDPRSTLRLDNVTLDFLDRALRVAADHGGNVARAQAETAEARRSLEHAALQTIPAQPSASRATAAGASVAAGPPSQAEAAAAHGLRWTVTATCFAVLIGAFQAIAGFAALLDETFFETKHDKLVLPLSYTAWGVIHLVLGFLLIAAGFALLVGKHWARKMGLVCIVLASLSAIANSLFAKANPAWSIVIIAMDAFLIYVLAAHGREAHY